MEYEMLNEYLGNIDALANTGRGSSEYVEPALKNLGSIAIPLIREVISPASFRNADQEITDVTSHGVRRIRAVANKFKYGERSRGLQVLRLMGAGGRMAQNRTFIGEKEKVSNGYDMNTVVFGDSANRGKKVLPVKAGVQYSDAVSVSSYVASVDSTFHNRASEDGTLWDAEEKKNSVNLFERHFVRPGTLLLQVLTLNGRTMTKEALRHLLVTIASAGAYGGQTSIYGVNVRNHVVGIYAGKFERGVASPYEAIKAVGDLEEADVATALSSFASVYREEYPVEITGEAVGAEISALMSRIESGDAELRTEYRSAAEKVGKFFDGWFGFGG